MTNDQQGNIYITTQENSVVQFNRNGDSLNIYRSARHGSIQTVDATNPFKILVYHASQSKIVLLDRFLSPTNEIDLRKINLYSPTAIGMSIDGNIWVFDQINSKLLKIDEHLNIILQSNDIRVETGVNPEICFLLEKDNKVYLCDENKGIFIFDRLGIFIQQLMIFNVNKIQITQDQVVYRKDNSLLSYNLKNFKENIFFSEKSLQEIVDITLDRKRIFFLTKKELKIYD